jgi:hypothetical protein
MQWLTDILTKIIPENWYTTKKTCDIITKLCDTIIELKWFVFPTIAVIAITLCLGFIYFCKLKITNIKYKQ